MRDLIPEDVLRLIRDRYLAGVADAEEKYRLNSADEDSLTGALGQAISTATPLTFHYRGKAYHWQIESHKVRGRGPNAPEKPLGVDGIFQIEVFDERGNSLRKKGLPFQSKHKWENADQKLLSQAKNMLAVTGTGIVIDYSPDGYSACPASDAVEVGTRRRKLDESGRMRSLGQILGNEFLDCTIGKRDLIYDRDAEKLLVSEEPIVPKHVIQTLVNIVPDERR